MNFLIGLFIGIVLTTCLATAHPPLFVKLRVKVAKAWDAIMAMAVIMAVSTLMYPSANVYASGDVLLNKQEQVNVSRNSNSNHNSSSSHSTGIGVGISHATSDSSARSGDSVSEATGGAAVSESHGGAGGGGGEGGSSEASLSVTNNESRARSKVTIRNTPSVFTPSSNSTISCFKGRSGGASVPGFGISFGGGKVDKGCVDRENIRQAHDMGLTLRAIFLWCSQESVSAKFESVDVCLNFTANTEATPSKKW